MMMKATNVETETKLIAASPATLERLPGALARLADHVKSDGVVQIRDTYFDTPDWWLYRAGLACRVRREKPVGNGHKGKTQTMLCLKELSRPVEGVSVRFELEEAMPGGVSNPSDLLAGDPPPQSLAAELKGLMHGRRLRPLFRVNNRRSVYRVLGPNSGAETRVCADEVTCEAGRLSESRAEIELETVSGTPQALRRLAGELADALRLEAGEMSKFRTGLKLAQLTAPGQPPPIDPDQSPREGGMSLGDRTIEAAYLAIAGQVERLRWYEPGTRLGLDPEYLHQMRVSTRRLRAALRMFKEPLGKRTAASLRERLKSVADALGEVRDLDVYLLSLPGWAGHVARGRSAKAADAAAGQGAGIDAISLFRDYLLKQRDAARKRLLAVLDSATYAHLLERLDALLSAGPPPGTRRKHAVMPLARFARKQIAARLDAALRLGRDVEPGCPDERLHELRLGVKRLRYNCEFVIDAYSGKAGKTVRRFIRRCTRLQEALGEFQDAIVASRLLREFTDGLDAAAIMTAADGTTQAQAKRALLDLGSLIAWKAQEADRQRTRSLELWSQFRRDKVLDQVRAGLDRSADEHRR